MKEGEFRPPREPLVQPGEIDHHIADLTATIAADVPLEMAQSELAKFDQWIPIDGDPQKTIGRLVDGNSSGPLRLGYGAWRDLLLGCQFKTPPGKLITAGGRTMKNVAGYDLVKFMVGQRGMFGSLLNITVRTYNRPSAALVAEFAPSDQWLGEILPTPLRPRYVILNNDALICGWLDDTPAISLFERLARDRDPAKLLRRSLEDDIRHRAQLWNLPDRHFRASLPPTALRRFATQAGVKNWVADAAFGVFIGPYLDMEMGRIQSAAESVGGSVIFFAPDQPPRWRKNPVEESILTAIRNAFVSAG